jgi:hypothetical protein
MTTMSYLKSDISPSDFQCKLLTAHRQRPWALLPAISSVIVILFSGVQSIWNVDGEAAEVALGV